MSNIEPLIKEEEEKLYVNGDIGTGKPNWLLIRTIICSFLVVLFLFRTLYAFYIGFRYYNLRFESNTVTEQTPAEEIAPQENIEQEIMDNSETQTPIENNPTELQ